MRELTRRDALASATALGAVALAGCVAENNDDGDNGGDDPDNTNDPDNGDDNGGESGSDPELELLETELTTTAADCGSGDMVEASITDGDIVLEGKVPASTPCHEAVLEDATLEGGTLSVTVGAESTRGEDEVCADCTGVVDYEATLGFSEDMADLSAFESFTVEHGGTSDETHTIEETGVVSGQVASGEGGSSREESPVLANSVVTTDRSCTSGMPTSEPERVDAGDDADFSQSENTVTVEGTINASTPCHEAYIENVSYDNGELTLVVGAESNADQDQACLQCLAELQYEATVEVAEGTAVNDVSVTHIQVSG